MIFTPNPSPLPQAVTAMDGGAKGLKRILWWAGLDEAGPQEQAVSDLLQGVLRAGSGKPEQDYQESLITLLSPPRAQPATCAAATQGENAGGTWRQSGIERVASGASAHTPSIAALLTLVRRGALSAKEAVDSLLTATEALLRSDEDPYAAFSTQPKAAITPIAPLLAAYVGALTELSCHIILEAARGKGEVAASLVLSEQPPLASALALSPVKVAAAVFEELSMYNRSSPPQQPHLVLPALIGPVAACVIFQPSRKPPSASPPTPVQV
jgi:hypothetical protein